MEDDVFEKWDVDREKGKRIYQVIGRLDGRPYGAWRGANRERWRQFERR
jgi:hypothetical protein